MIIPGQRRKQLAFLVLHSKHVYCTKIWHVNWVFMCTQVKSVSSMTSACTAYTIILNHMINDMKSVSLIGQILQTTDITLTLESLFLYLHPKQVTECWCRENLKGTFGHFLYWNRGSNTCTSHPHPPNPNFL